MSHRETSVSQAESKSLRDCYCSAMVGWLSSFLHYCVGFACDMPRCSVAAAQLDIDLGLEAILLHGYISTD